MFEGIINFFKKFSKNEEESKSKDTAKERLHLVLMQDRANVSADFLDMMKQEIIDVIKKYIEVDEKEIDVKLTNKTNEDGSIGAPALYANIPISKIKNENKSNKLNELSEKEKIEKEKNTVNENDKTNQNNKENIEVEENKKSVKNNEEDDKKEEIKENIIENEKQVINEKNDNHPEKKVENGKTEKKITSKNKKSTK